MTYVTVSTLLKLLIIHFVILRMNDYYLINHDYLPISILLYIMLYIMLAYLMLFAALSNAVCMYNAFFFFAIDFCKCFLFPCFVLVY